MKIDANTEDALTAVEWLYDKAAILGELVGKDPQALIIQFSEFNGYSLDSRERCLEYLRRKPEGRWVFMTDMKIGDEISRVTLPTDEEMAEWGAEPTLEAQLKASISALEGDVK